MSIEGFIVHDNTAWVRRGSVNVYYCAHCNSALATTLLEDGKVPDSLVCPLCEGGYIISVGYALNVWFKASKEVTLCLGGVWYRPTKEFFYSGLNDRQRERVLGGCLLLRPFREGFETAGIDGFEEEDEGGRCNRLKRFYKDVTPSVN